MNLLCFVFYHLSHLWCLQSTSVELAYNVLSNHYCLLEIRRSELVPAQSSVLLCTVKQKIINIVTSCFWMMIYTLILKLYSFLNSFTLDFDAQTCKILDQIIRWILNSCQRTIIKKKNLTKRSLYSSFSPLTGQYFPCYPAIQ